MHLVMIPLIPSISTFNKFPTITQKPLVRNLHCSLKFFLCMVHRKMYVSQSRFFFFLVGVNSFRLYTNPHQQSNLTIHNTWYTQYMWLGHLFSLSKHEFVTCKCGYYIKHLYKMLHVEVIYFMQLFRSEQINFKAHLFFGLFLIDFFFFTLIPLWDF